MQLSPHIRKGLTSPVTGRITLPPPTPRSERIKPRLFPADNQQKQQAVESSNRSHSTGQLDSAGESISAGGASDELSGGAPVTRRHKSASEMSPSGSGATVLFRTPGSTTSATERRPISAHSCDDSEDDGSEDGDAARLACDVGVNDMAPPRAGRIGSSNSVLASLDVNKMRGGSGGSCTGQPAKRNYSYSMGGGLFSGQNSVERENSLRSVTDKSK
jgi:hypothetical protein